MLRMLTKFVLCSAFLLLICGAATAEMPSDAIEPADAYSIVIDGKEYPVAIDQAKELEIGKQKIDLTLKVAPYKTFSRAGISLEYPRHFTFETDQGDPTVKFWNLSGITAVLMIQKYAAEMEHEVMGKMLVQRFGEENSKISACTMNFMGNEHQGTKVTTTIGDSSIAQEIFAFKSDGHTILLILQDSIDSAGKGTEEGTKFREVLSRSFKLTGAMPNG